jgi:hypothetical protein
MWVSWGWIFQGIEKTTIWSERVVEKRQLPNFPAEMRQKQPAWPKS